MDGSLGVRALGGLCFLPFFLPFLLPSLPPSLLPSFCSPSHFHSFSFTSSFCFFFCFLPFFLSFAASWTCPYCHPGAPVPIPLAFGLAVAELQSWRDTRACGESSSKALVHERDPCLGQTPSPYRLGWPFSPCPLSSGLRSLHAVDKVGREQMCFAWKAPLICHLYITVCTTCCGCADLRTQADHGFNVE